MMPEVLRLAIPDILVITPALFTDNRGAFQETWNERDFSELGLPTTFVQDNQSVSHAGVIRGLHYQLRQPQGKLVRAVKGRIFDVAVDVRASSPTIGQWVGRELSESNREALWIPAGFAHGFCALTNDTIIQYKCTDYYAPNDEYTIRWDDQVIGITWPDIASPVISDKDRAGNTWENSPRYQTLAT